VSFKIDIKKVFSPPLQNNNNNNNNKTAYTAVFTAI
jgi:hypothetical protein